MAQLDRAFGYGPKGWGFESLRAYQCQSNRPDSKWNYMISLHEKWMKQALVEAEKAYEKKEIPVGAVIVFDNKIIGRGHNLTESLQDPTAHAEMLAITAAANFLNHWRLINSDIYVTLEPCPMCAGAILNSRIRTVIFAAFDKRFGACGSVTNVFENNVLSLTVDVIPAVLQSKSETSLKEFFNSLRDKIFAERKN